MTEQLHKTPLYNLHVELGAKTELFDRRLQLQQPAISTLRQMRS